MMNFNFYGKIGFTPKMAQQSSGGKMFLYEFARPGNELFFQDR
jgi:hypothetical protein